MSNSPTHEDANLILKLYELRRETKMRLARDWFAMNMRAKTMKEFEALCPTGSDENAYSRMVISYWEMVATFITSGILNAELFYQTGGELMLVWERLRELAPAFREQYKNPATYRNLQEVAEGMMKWYAERAPEFPEQFRRRMSAPPPQKSQDAGH